MKSLYVTLLKIAPAILCAAIFSGCSGCGTEPGEPLIKAPKSGSSFTYVNYAKDSLGELIPGSRRTSTRVISATGLTHMGKGDVVRFLDGPDTVYLHYASNGDAAFLQPAISYPGDNFPTLPGLPSISVPARWVLFPFGSKTAITLPSYDTTITVDAGGFPVPVNVDAEGVTSFIGTEKLTVGTESIETQKGLLKVDISFSAFLVGTGTITTIDTVWFAPKLGMFIKDDGMTTGNLPEQFGGRQRFGGTYSELTSYSLK